MKQKTAILFGVAVAAIASGLFGFLMLMVGGFLWTITGVTLIGFSILVLLGLIFGRK